jgi:hypothetical protein
MNISPKHSLIAIAVLFVICAFLGVKLYVNSNNYDTLYGDFGVVTLEKDQVVLDLEKMRFSYDTLKTDNAMMIAEIAAQRDRVDGLLTKVKNGNWSLARAKKESETLRVIMKGYIVTIDSINQLNMALNVENMVMKERVEEVQGRNANLEKRQENMADIIEAGQVLQCSEITASGVRIVSSGRQRTTTRASKTDMIKVCFTILENRIAESGNKDLHLRITASDGSVLASEGNEYSATRSIDYANDRLVTCIFYTSENDELMLSSGTYEIEILEGDFTIGTTSLELR